MAIKREGFIHKTHDAKFEWLFSQILLAQKRHTQWRDDKGFWNNLFFFQKNTRFKRKLRVHQTRVLWGRPYSTECPLHRHALEHGPNYQTLFWHVKKISVVFILSVFIDNLGVSQTRSSACFLPLKTRHSSIMSVFQRRQATWVLELTAIIRCFFHLKIFLLFLHFYFRSH